VQSIDDTFSLRRQYGWQIELDLRSIKVTLQMDRLRCKTPELVRKEIWTHVLAYNLIRTVMAQAADREGIAPRSISFKATLQVLEAFRPLIAHQAHRGVGHRAALYQQLLMAIAVHRVADRPDRFEPRMTKKGPRGYEELKRPRAEGVQTPNPQTSEQNLSAIRVVDRGHFLRWRHLEAGASFCAQSASVAIVRSRSAPRCSE
jgi:hypothetical protein